MVSQVKKDKAGFGKTNIVVEPKKFGRAIVCGLIKQNISFKLC